MPSHPDLTDVEGADRTVAAPAITHSVAPADVLASVKREGMRRRARRHRRNGVLAVIGLVLVAVPAVALLPGDDGSEDITVAADADGADDVGRTTVDRPVTTVSPTTAPPTTVPVEVDDAEAPVTTVESDREPAPVTTVPAAPTCRNSTDPACGEFRWDPQPAPNQPLTAAFVDAPATAAVGEEVTFAVAWSDPDAQLEYDSFSADGVGLAQACAMQPRYGPWTPPDAVAGSGELSYTHVFTEAGTYTVVVSLGTGDCTGPYADTATVEATVTVE